MDGRYDVTIYSIFHEWKNIYASFQNQNIFVSKSILVKLLINVLKTY